MDSMIPSELRKYPNWVVWRYEERDGRKTKVPYNAITGRAARSNDSTTWNTWEQVATLPTWANGVGFMFSDSPFVGIDIDHCIDGGAKEQAARDIVKSIGTYAEVSPSGEGLHLIGRAELTKGARFKTPNFEVEIYPHGRYFTVTGKVFDGCNAINGIQDNLNVLIHSLQDKPPVVHKAKTPKPILPSSAGEIVELIRRSQQAGLFSALYDRGDTSLYGGDDSAADMALMNILPFWTGGNADLMKQIFSSSALGARDKWRNREDYRRWTVEKALKAWNGQSYSPNSRAADIKELCDKFGVAPKNASTLLKFPLTDLGNAERLKHLYGNNLLYVEAANHWLVWDGKRWAEEQGKEGLKVYDKVSDTLRLAYAVAEQAYRQSPARSKEDERVRTAVLTYLKKSENMQMTSNCIRRARSLFMVDREKLDSKVYLLNCPNGTVNLQTGEIKPHIREDYITMITRADYVPSAQSELWENTLNTILPDVTTRAWIQKFMGYCLFGLTSEEKFLFLYGAGGGGKGTFIESIGYVLGDYAGTMDIDTILAARNDAGDGGQATPQLAGLAGKRLVLTSESGAGRKFNSARIKLITGGDRITARFLHGNPFTFTPQFTLIMSSNFKPTLADTTDEGMKRRLVIVPFTAQIDNKDIQLKQRLHNEAQEAILAWCIDGAVKWWNEGLGEMPSEIVKLMGDYYAENDLLGLFLEECCEVGQGKRAKVRELWENYNKWLRDGRGVSFKTFAEQMTNRGYRKHKYNFGTVFEGVALRENIEVPF